MSKPVMTNDERLALFDQVYEQFQRMVWKESNKVSGIVGALSQNTVTAEDIVQETWLNIMNNLHTYDETRGCWSTWITLRCKTVKHYMIARFNRKSRLVTDKEFVPLDKEIHDAKHSISDMVGDDINVSEESLGKMIGIYYVYLIAQFLDKLKETQKYVVGSHILGISSSVVTERFNISRQAYRQSLDRGLKKLRIYISAHIDKVNHDTATDFCKKISDGKYFDVGMEYDTCLLCRAILDKLVRGI